MWRRCTRLKGELRARGLRRECGFRPRRTPRPWSARSRLPWSRGSGDESEDHAARGPRRFCASDRCARVGARAGGSRAMKPDRTASVERTTRETSIRAEVAVDGSGRTEIRTGVGFLDHLLESLARHARLDLTVEARGDLQVDDHHTAEDCALALGEALDRALGERRGINRFGWALAPLDDGLARAVVDLSGRSFSDVALGLRREGIGGPAFENIAHVLRSLPTADRTTLHVDVLKGDNDQHRAEAAVKATAPAPP